MPLFFRVLQLNLEIINAVCSSLADNSILSTSDREFFRTASSRYFIWLVSHLERKRDG